MLDHFIPEAAREPVMVLVIAVLGLSTTFAFVARDVELVEQSQSRTVVSLRTQPLYNGSGIETYTCTNCEMKEYALPWLV
jgi:hypothetical protein